MQREIFERGEAPGEALPLEPLAIERLKDTRAPTLAIFGDQNLSSMKEITDLITRRVPGARKAIIEDAAHVPNMERPAEFNRVVLEFLDSVRP
jgi:pimeloyl-ACP methyl ester carboxylesterase